MRHEPFLQAIAAAPHDPTPRLIYADWLEERGDARSEFIRLHARLAEQPDDDLAGPSLQLQWQFGDVSIEYLESQEFRSRFTLIVRVDRRK